MSYCRGEFKDFERAALSQGWGVSKTNGSHIRFRAPTGALVFASSTPSDRRAYYKCRSVLRKAGLSV